MLWDNLPVANYGETQEVETSGREKIVLCFCRLGVFKINFLKTWDAGLRASLTKLICNYTDSELHRFTQLWRYVFIFQGKMRPRTLEASPVKKLELI